MVFIKIDKTKKILVNKKDFKVIKKINKNMSLVRFNSSKDYGVYYKTDNYLNYAKMTFNVKEFKSWEEGLNNE
jgi:hypothetical protein